MRPKLGAFAGVQPALKERAEDRWVDLGPIEARRRQHGVDIGFLQRQRRVVVEQPTVEPSDRFEADPASGDHCSEEIAGEVGELRRGALRLIQHPCEHAVGQQTHIFGEHAEYETVDEVRNCVRLVSALT